MERLAVKKLEKWLESPLRKPMVVWGARQVGKTYLIRDLFAKRYFPENSIYIDFRVENEITEYCTEHIDPNDIIRYISAVKRQPVTPETLLIFDEIQECPAIITSLKYFCQDLRSQPVIATGSMVRIKIQRETHKRGPGSKQFLFPVGKINQLTLYPMTFDEFLLNDNEPLYDMIREAYSSGTALEPAVHDLAMEALYQFLLIGGMPEAVDTFIRTRDYLESQQILKDLYDNYLSDMELYQASPESVIRSRNVFQGIYRELNRESKNFSPGLIESGKKVRDFRAPIDWLTMAHVIHRSFQVKEHALLPLMPDEDALFRLYLGDIGMFSWQSGAGVSAFLTKSGQNKLAGIFFENYVALELAARDIPLYYWRGKNDAEIEFIVEANSSAVPIDVKKGRGSLNSLEKFRNHNSSGIAIKISANNREYDPSKNLLTLPLYETPFLSEDLAAGKIFGVGNNNQTGLSALQNDF